MVLVIDIGNTKIKLAVFEQHTIVFTQNIAYNQWEYEIENTIKKFNITQLFVSSVGKLTDKDFKIFKDCTINFINENTRLPFTNLYKTPTTLGNDRKVLAAGAVLLFPNKNRLIIDAGTCVTYDFVDKENNYQGGAISPGIRLRYESLHNFTANLPLLQKEKPLSIVGNSTNQSIHSGVVNGLINEIDGFINSYYNNYENFIIILTGGDADFLAMQLKNSIFVHSNFLLESLYLIYQYNHND